MRYAALLEIRAMLLRRIERPRHQRMLQTDDRSLHGEIAAANQMAAMEQPQLAGVASEMQRLAGINRSHADSKTPGIGGRDLSRDLLGQRGIDEFALAE